MSRNTKILIWAGVLLVIAIAAHFLFFRNQTNQIEIQDPEKAQMIRNFRQSMQPGLPPTPQPQQSR